MRIPRPTLIVLLGALPSCYSLPEIEMPDSIVVGHKWQGNIREVSDTASMTRLDQFLHERESGWQHWRRTYIGDKVAHPYAYINARNPAGKSIYSVGVDENYITFRQGEISLRRKSSKVEHDELLGIVGVPDTRFDEIVRAISTTYDLMVPVREACTRHLRDVGRYPTTAEGMRALVRDSGAAGWAGPYLSSMPKDHWGKPLRYHQYRYDNAADGVHVTIEYLWSAGADGKFESDQKEGGPSLETSVDDLVDNLPDAD